MYFLPDLAKGVQLLRKISLLCQNTSCARWSHRIHKMRAILSSKYAHTNYLHKNNLIYLVCTRGFEAKIGTKLVFVSRNKPFKKEKWL